MQDTIPIAENPAGGDGAQLTKQSILFVVGQTNSENQFAPPLIQQYSISIAHVRRDALSMLETFTPDIILIDVPTIRFNLERFIESAKLLSLSSSIFLLLSKGTRLDQVPKAHGYLRYPATPRQLLNRLERIVPQSQEHTVVWRSLQLNTESRLLMWNDEQLPVTPKQAALVQAFFDADAELVTRAQLMQEVWGTDYLGDTRTLDVHIHWLRKALIQLGAPFQIKTERGKGYRFVGDN